MLLTKGRAVRQNGCDGRAIDSLYDESYDIKMSRPQDIYFDYNARQQYLRERARGPSHRPRKRWPPLPRAEEEVVSLAQELEPDSPDAGGKEARSRGALDQQPIILDVDLPVPKTRPLPRKEREAKLRDCDSEEDSTSSDESTGPETPTNSSSEDEKRNRDRRYVFIPQEGVEIPLTYDEPRTPIHAKRSESHAPAGPPRGRRIVPKLDTDISRAKSSHDVPIQMERERSPYSSAPRTRETRFSREFLLSPEAMSPKIRHHDTSSHASAQKQRDFSTNAGHLSGRSEHKPASPARPSVMRHASAMAYPGEAAKMMHSPPRSGPSQATRATHGHRDSLKIDAHFPVSPRKASDSGSDGLSVNLPPSAHHLRQSSVPPPRALPASTDKAPSPSMALPNFAGQQSLNAMLSGSLSDRRRASPRNSPRSSPQGSPSSSPLTSPPRTPPAEAGTRKFSYMESVKGSGSYPRPSSPLHPSQPSKATDHLNYGGSESRNLRPPIRSRQTSPLPSAVEANLEPNSAPRIDIRSPSRSPSRHRRSSTYGGDDQRSRRQPSPAPEAQASLRTDPNTLRPNGLERRRRSSSTVDSRPRLTVDASRAQETAGSPQSRLLSIKSPTSARAASVGAPPPALPPCSRPVPVAGYNDWYSLPDYTSFKICPTCREAVSQAGFGRHLVAATSKSPERPVRCSFSIPWIRMAYLLMVKKRRSDVDLLNDMADVAEYTPPCPGKRPTVREWYRIQDIDSDRHVPGFYACPYCIRSLETIFPVLKGVFHRSRSRHSVEEASCSLRSDSSRFATYVDLLEDTANQANEYRRAPNIYRFVELTKKIGAIPPCSRDDMLRGRVWHIIPSLPEFTACSECYEDVVWPAVLQGSALASRCTRSPQAVAKAHVEVSCQMYSSKMRKVFLKACAEDDFDYLRKVALKRYRVERDLQNRIVEAQRLPRTQREGVMEDIVDEWQEWD
ncbi:MAG: hypothetical protein Q9188_007089 [Gyalolechia gomerana]